MKFIEALLTDSFKSQKLILKVNGKSEQIKSARKEAGPHFSVKTFFFFL